MIRDVKPQDATAITKIYNEYITAECTHKYVNICKSTCNKRSNYIVLKHH